MEEMKEIKKMLGVILGEIYELKNQIAEMRQENIPNEQFTIEGLKGTYEHIIDREFRLDSSFALTTECYENIGKVLEDYEINNLEAVNNLNGFDDLPMNIREKFDQNQWLLALRAMKNERIFNNIISCIENGTNTPDRFKNLN